MLSLLKTLRSQPDCTGQSGLTGERLARPRKLVLMFLFGFEVDTLEIALREQQDLVDKIFLVESSATHRGVCLSPFHLRSDHFSLSDCQTSPVGD